MVDFFLTTLSQQILYPSTSPPPPVCYYLCFLASNFLDPRGSPGGGSKRKLHPSIRCSIVDDAIHTPNAIHPRRFSPFCIRGVAVACRHSKPPPPTSISNQTTFIYKQPLGFWAKNVADGPRFHRFSRQILLLPQKNVGPGI